ncbi:MAG: YIP1 family protein [Clostridia bacterium]|nr:YIP1 family protein [Clostridia bacterium]
MKMKQFVSWLLLLLLLLPCVTAQAATPYRTFSLGSDMREVETQTAYDPIRTMTRFGDETLKSPTDLRLGPDGNLYIADNGNKRVVVITPEGELVRVIEPLNEKGKALLKSCRGIYVAPDLTVYIADENGRAVYQVDQDGNVLRTFEKPTHQLFGDKSAYKPNKIVLDKRGNLYIASTGNTSGIVQLSPIGNGEFLGYYGANNSNINFLTLIKRTLFKDNSLVMGDIVPVSVANLCIDAKGMVYTVTETGDLTSLRRLNVAGKNTLTVDYITMGNSAVAVNSSGSIFVATKDGYITEYTSEGAMLFSFGAFDAGEQRVGMFKSVTGIVVDDSYTIYVLDESLGSIQVLQPTEFADLVHQAFTLFTEGKYAESKEPWLEVLRMNSMFNYASTGLGEALYREGNFAEAMEAYRNGGEKQGYSDAWWEERSNWLHSHMSTIIIALAAVIVVWQILKFCDRKWKILEPLRKVRDFITGVPIIAQLLYCGEILRNPYDCCYGIKREKRAGYISALIVLLIFFALYVVNTYFAGFLFKTVPDGYYALLNDFLLVFGVFFLLVICCYLVCTITDGESSFRDLFVGCAYALTPMLIFMPIKLVLTNVLTFNEEFFITLIDVVAIGWSALLVILVLMYQNDYTLGKTLVTIILTLFTVLVVVALAVVLYMLISQLVDFITSIYGEVVYRFVKKV